MTPRSRHIATAGLALAGLLGAWASPAGAAPLSDADRKLVIFHAEADRLLAAGQSKAWPGFSWTRYPLVVFEDGKVAFQFNGQRPLPGFSPLAAPPARGRSPIFVRYGSTRSLVPGAAMDDYVVQVGGQQIIPIARNGIEEALPGGYSPASLLYFPLLVSLKDRYSWFGEYMRRGEDWIEQYPLRDTGNLALISLEHACLKHAASATVEEEARKAARWFVAVRMTRQGKLSASSARHESYQEALVATARYGALYLASAGSSPDYTPLAILKTVARGWIPPTQNDISKSVVAALDAPLDGRAEALTRTRLTTSGMAQALLLDRFQAADWRAHLPGADALTPLLARALGYSDGARTSLVDEAKQALDFVALDAQAQGIPAHNARMIEAFERQPGWTVKIRLPGSSPGVGLRWAPAGYNPLEIDSRTRLFAAPYKFIELETSEIRLEVTGIPTKFYSTEYVNPYRNLIVRLPLERGSVKLDGRPLDLRPAIRTIGRSLTIKVPSKADIAFKKGRVIVGRDTLEIQP